MPEINNSICRESMAQMSWLWILAPIALHCLAATLVWIAGWQQIVMEKEVILKAG
jgi:hypothetical protein